MEISNKIHISLCAEDVKDMVIKQLYHSQGISGIFDIKFKIVNKPIKSVIGEMDHYIFDGAEIIVNLNEKQ
jgi:hypothetical protein